MNDPAATGTSDTASTEPGRLWRESMEYQELFSSERGTPYATARFLVVGSFVTVVVTIEAAIRTLGAGRSGGAPDIWMVLLRSVQAALLTAAILLLIGIAFRYLSARRAFRDRVRSGKENAVHEAVRVLRDDLSLENLFVLNRSQMDEYHELSVRQQDDAFRNAQIASTVAFAILCAGGTAVFVLSDVATQWITGGLAAFGATLSSYVAATFYKSYDATSRQLQVYYREPCRASRVLALERLAEQAGRDWDPAQRWKLWRGLFDYLYAQPLVEPALAEKAVTRAGPPPRTEPGAPTPIRNGTVPLGRPS